jgi:hypothetical protein
MKTTNILIILISVFLLSTNVLQSQEKYYYGFDEKIYLTEIDEKMLICLNNDNMANIEKFVNSEQYSMEEQ